MAKDSFCFSTTVCGRCPRYVMGGYCEVFDCVRSYNEKPLMQQVIEVKNDTRTNMRISE